MLHTTVPYGRIREWLRRPNASDGGGSNGNALGLVDGGGGGGANGGMNGTATANGTRSDPGAGWILDCPVPDDVKIPMYALEQTGQYVIAALSTRRGKLAKQQEYTPGEEVHAISEWLSPADIARRLSRLANAPVTTARVSREDFASLETHERLSVRWDAWNQLLSGEYSAEYAASGSHAPPPGVSPWTLEEWFAQEPDFQRMLKEG